MTLKLVTGDPLLTQMPYLAVGHNARGRSELGDFETALAQKSPAALASYTRKARRGKIKPGTLWFWSEAQPKLIFLSIRDSAVGATRLRYVQSVLITLARDYSLYNIQGVALAPLGNAYEQPEILKLLEMWLAPSPLPIVAYTAYLQGVQADEA